MRVLLPESVMASRYSIGVFCGSSTGNDPLHERAAARLGRLAAGRNVHLVYGGGKVGLMGIVADAALEAGGRVTGVIPRHLRRAEVAHDGLTELITVETMHERKHRMFSLADAFVVLPGGIGTFDEMIEIISWRLLRLHDKAILLVDPEGYWEPFTELLEHAIAKGFARPETRRLFTRVADVEEIFARIEAAPKGEAHPERL
jgi:uncharacterized protein (TIGR00730 family)